ncbi:hypothetical protein AB4305_03150 [Nocardia sp. 2YAB30]|uniref:hypothetical protein n=1 Tax=unclassified Nocardia TaxID=2637762 RepID=UPI003F9A0063
MLCELRDQLAEREDVFAAMLGEVFDDRFEVRRHGLIATVTIASDRMREAWAAHAVPACSAAGLLVRPNDHGRRLLIKPPLVLPESELRACLATMAHLCEQAIDEIATVRPAESARTGVAFPAGTVLRKPLQPNPNEGYVAALLRAAPVHLRIASRDAAAQQDLTRRLAEIGVPTAAIYATPDGEAIDYGFVPGRSLRQVLTDPSTDAAAINGLALRHHELICRAHDNGIILGDRWPGNAIASGADVILIDFDLGYDGPAHELMLFEEAFAVLQTLVAIPADYIGREDLEGRLVDAVAARHGTARTESEFARLAEWYLDPARPVHPSSDPTNTYRAIVTPALARLSGIRH